MKDMANQEFLAKQTICKEVWDALKALETEIHQDSTTKHMIPMLERIETAFCDFECSWAQHSKEYHT